MKRRTLFWISLAIVLLGPPLAGAALRAQALTEAENLLRARGFTWDDHRAGLLDAQWSGLEGVGIRVDRVEARIWPAPEVRLSGVWLDAAELRESATETDVDPTWITEAGTPEIWGMPIAIWAEGVDIYWADRLVLRSLSGTLTGDVHLSAGDQFLSGTPSDWTLQRPFSIETEYLNGDARITLQCTRSCRTTILMESAVIAHPLLSPEPLPPGTLRLEGELDPVTHAFEGTATLGELQSQVAFGGRDEAGHWRVDFETAELDFGDLVAVFGETIPENTRARPRGTVRITGWLDDTGGWEVQPTVSDLGCSGLLTDTAGLRHGEVVWTARDADGEPQRRHTGPGVAGFTPIQEARTLANAIIAAEDAGFRTHPGYDMAAVREAMRRMLEEPESGLRGGSTLTQQLAKNLFLDASERTLRRKIRELLYTLELERSLTKDEILQLYINVVEFGPGTWGASPAAEAMFMRRPGNLTLLESVYLASVLPAPTQYWERNYLRGRPPAWRMRIILDNMVDGGTLTSAEARQSVPSALRFVPPP